jgi:hypothetical protein
MVTGSERLGPLSDCTVDPSSRQRGRPTETRPQLPDSNIPTGSNIWSKVTEWARHQDILTDRQSYCDLDIMQAYEEVGRVVRVKFPAFLTMTLEGGEWLVSRSGRFT